MAIPTYKFSMDKVNGSIVFSLRGEKLGAGRQGAAFGCTMLLFCVPLFVIGLFGAAAIGDKRYELGITLILIGWGLLALLVARMSGLWKKSHEERNTIQSIVVKCDGIEKDGVKYDYSYIHDISIPDPFASGHYYQSSSSSGPGFVLIGSGAAGMAMVGAAALGQTAIEGAKATVSAINQTAVKDEKEKSYKITITYGQDVVTLFDFMSKITAEILYNKFIDAINRLRSGEAVVIEEAFRSEVQERYANAATFSTARFEQEKAERRERGVCTVCAGPLGSSKEKTLGYCNTCASK